MSVARPAETKIETQVETKSNLTDFFKQEAGKLVFQGTSHVIHLKLNSKPKTAEDFYRLADQLETAPAGLLEFPEHTESRETAKLMPIMGKDEEGNTSFHPGNARKIASLLWRKKSVHAHANKLKTQAFIYNLLQAAAANHSAAAQQRLEILVKTNPDFTAEGNPYLADWNLLQNSSFNPELHFWVRGIKTPEILPQFERLIKAIQEQGWRGLHHILYSPAHKELVIDQLKKKIEGIRQTTRNWLVNETSKIIRDFNAYQHILPDTITKTVTTIRNVGVKHFNSETDLKHMEGLIRSLLDLLPAVEERAAAQADLIKLASILYLPEKNVEERLEERAEALYLPEKDVEERAEAKTAEAPAATLASPGLTPHAPHIHAPRPSTILGTALPSLANPAVMYSPLNRLRRTTSVSEALRPQPDADQDLATKLTA